MASTFDERHLAVFQIEFLEDLAHWMATDRRVGIKLLGLVKAVLREPFSGIGHPERLRQFEGEVWSRRITQEHRLVYLVEPDKIHFLQGRFHY